MPVVRSRRGGAAKIPYEIEITDHVHLTWTGELTCDTVRSALQAIFQHTAFRKGMAIVSQNCPPNYNPSADELRSVANEWLRLKERIGPVAVVVEQDVHVGLFSMLRAYCQVEGLRIEVFRNMDEALVWIGKDGNVFDLPQT